MIRSTIAAIACLVVGGACWVALQGSGGVIGHGSGGGTVVVDTQPSNSVHDEATSTLSAAVGDTITVASYPSATKFYVHVIGTSTSVAVAAGTFEVLQNGKYYGSVSTAAGDNLLIFDPPLEFDTSSGNIAIVYTSAGLGTRHLWWHGSWK